jgi:transposase-like protein
MLKDSEISNYSTRRTHRTYSPEFKADLVAACQHPGVSIAALAGQHGMNANVLHRWLREHQRSSCSPLAAQGTPHSPDTSKAPGLRAFVPVTLSASMPVDDIQQNPQEIRIELRKGALTMVVSWPMRAAADLASWTAAVLK